MTNEERMYRRFAIEFKRGCHGDLACLCTIWVKWQKMVAAMGPDWAEVFVNDMCFTCAVTPPPLDPGRPINPGTNQPIDFPQPQPPPPEEEDPPPPEEDIVVRLMCAPPAEQVILAAAANEQVSETVTTGPNA